MAKNEYANGYHLSPIIDGHDWGPIPREPWVDAAKCRDCGVEASNASIALRRFTHNDAPIPECTVPAE